MCILVIDNEGENNYIRKTEGLPAEVTLQDGP